jgi:hypothetical protein
VVGHAVLPCVVEHNVAFPCDAVNTISNATMGAFMYLYAGRKLAISFAFPGFALGFVSCASRRTYRSPPATAD